MHDSQPGASGAANVSTGDGRGKDVVGGGGGLMKSLPVVTGLHTMQTICAQIYLKPSAFRSTCTVQLITA